MLFRKAKKIINNMDCLLWDIITYFRVFIQQIGKRRYRGVKEKEFDQENGPK